MGSDSGERETGARGVGRKGWFAVVQGRRRRRVCPSLDGGEAVESRVGRGEDEFSEVTEG